MGEGGGEVLSCPLGNNEEWNNSCTNVVFVYCSRML